uniref:Uncharacterized protein n=1 Tax=Acrobeloides nanus TaxID=290746 RepID=A0A914CLU4_9BILA
MKASNRANMTKIASSLLSIVSSTNPKLMAKKSSYGEQKTKINFTKSGLNEAIKVSETKFQKWSINLD